MEVSSGGEFLLELNAGAVFGESALAAPKTRMATLEAKVHAHTNTYAHLSLFLSFRNCVSCLCCMPVTSLKFSLLIRK